MAKVPISRLNSAPEKYEQNDFNQLIEDLQVGIPVQFINFRD